MKKKSHQSPGKAPPKTPPKTLENKSKKKSGDDAWARLKASTTPLPETAKNRHLETPAGQKPPKPTASKTDNPPAMRGAEKAAMAPAPVLKPQKPPPRIGLDQKAKRRLSRGHIDIEARLDLHGLSLAQAHRSLIGFVSAAVAQKKTWILVITGKGVRGEGKLRGALPDWLASPPLAAQIAEYGAAAPNHGGDGAFYLRLRRSARP